MIQAETASGVLDVSISTPISITISSAQQDDATSRADYSASFTLLPTAHNANILSHAGANELEHRWQVSRIAARLTDGGAVISRGYIYLNSRSADGWAATYVGGNVGFLDEISDMSIRDLDLGRIKYGGLYGDDLDPWPAWADTDYVPLADLVAQEPGRGYHFGVVAYGNFASNSTAPSPRDGSTPIRDIRGPINSAVIDNSEAFSLHWSEYKPIVHVRAVLEAMAKRAGYGLDIHDARIPLDGYALPYVGSGPRPWNWGTLGAIKYGYVGNRRYGVAGTGFTTKDAARYFMQGSGTTQAIVHGPVLPSEFDYPLNPAQGDAKLSRTAAEGGFDTQVQAAVAMSDGRYKIDYSMILEEAIQSDTPPPPATTAILFALHIVRGVGGLPVNASGSDLRDAGVQDYDYVFSDGSLGSIASLNNAVSAGLLAAWDTYTCISASSDAPGTDTRGPKTFTFSGEVVLEAGDYILPVLYVSGLAPSTLQISQTDMSLVPVAMDAEIDVAKWLPDMRVRDFFAGILTYFDLVPTIVGETLCLVDTRTYRGRGAILDMVETGGALNTEPPQVGNKVDIVYAEDDPDFFRRAESQSAGSIIPAKEISLPFAVGSDRMFALRLDDGEVFYALLGNISGDDAYSQSPGELYRGEATTKYAHKPRLMRIGGEPIGHIEPGTAFYISGVPYMGDGGIGTDRILFGSAYATMQGLLYNPAPNLVARQNALYRGGTAKCTVILTSDEAAWICRRPVRIGGRLWYVLEAGGWQGSGSSATLSLRPYW